MPYKLYETHNIMQNSAAYEVFGDFPASFRNFTSQILSMEEALMVTFFLPREICRARWGCDTACTILMRKVEGAWVPVKKESSEWYRRLFHETVVSCNASGNTDHRVYYLVLSSFPQEVADTSEEAKSQRVKVRYVPDYNNFPKSSLVAMLHDRDRHIERLQADLYASSEQEQLWKNEAAKLEEENRLLKEEAQKGRGTHPQPAPNKGTPSLTRKSEPNVRLKQLMTQTNK